MTDQGQPPKIRMVVDGKPVCPFNRDSQKIREQDVGIFLSYEIRRINVTRPPRLKRKGE
jgi:hypothetical protein